MKGDQQPAALSGEAPAERREGPHDYADRICRAAAEEILRIVRERGIPLKALAERSGLARSLIYRMRGGEGHVTLYILAQLSHGAGVPVRDVLLAVEPMETGGRDGREDRGLGVSE